MYLSCVVTIHMQNKNKNNFFRSVVLFCNITLLFVTWLYVVYIKKLKDGDATGWSLMHRVRTNRNSSAANPRRTFTEKTTATSVIWLRFGFKRSDTERKTAIWKLRHPTPTQQTIWGKSVKKNTLASKKCEVKQVVDQVGQAAKRKTKTRGR